jgi:hypothetical protein
LSALVILGPTAAAEDHQKRVDNAVKKAVDFLLKQQQETVLLITGSGKDFKTEKVAAEWKDVKVDKAALTVTIKGKVYKDVYAAMPPGWFDPEPATRKLFRGEVSCDQATGHTALITLSLLAAGVSPKSEPRLMRAIDCLLGLHVEQPKPGVTGKPKEGDTELAPGPAGTYAIALRACALEYGLRKLKGSPKAAEMFKALERDAKQLSEGYWDAGGWTYTMRPGHGAGAKGTKNWDLSNTQYGVLGIWAAARAGVELKTDLWKHFNDLLIEKQTKDGGWWYYYPDDRDENNGKAPRSSMTAAGAATLFLCLDYYHTRQRGVGKPDISPFSADLLKNIGALERAMDSFGRTYEPDPRDGYYMYGAERVGVAGGYKYFGDHDWFREGSEAVMDAQDAEGSWKGFGQTGRTAATAYNIMFLVYGNGPVLINKLRYGDKSDWTWHNYPRDAANLCAWYSQTYETHVNWQIVSLSGTGGKDAKGKAGAGGTDRVVEDLLDAPITYISGHKPFDPSDAEVETLRRYIERGGTVLMVANAGTAAFTDSAVKLSRRLYPEAEFPEYGLTALPATHPVVAMNTDPKKPNKLARIPVLHASNGHRSFLFVVTEDINHVWHGSRSAQRPECFELVANIASYAVDKGALPAKVRPAVAADEPRAKGKAGSFKVATGRYASKGQVMMQAAPGKGQAVPVAAKADWAAAGAAWTHYAEWFKAVADGELTEARGVALTEADLKGVDLLHLTGHYGFALTDAEKKAVKDFVSGGGTLLLDAAGGTGGEFAANATALVRELFGDKLEELKASSPAISGEGGLRNAAKAGFSRRARLDRAGLSSPAEVCKAVHLDGRCAVLVTPFDLSVALGDGRCWDRIGFSATTARELIANLLLSAKSGRKAAAK